MIPKDFILGDDMDLVIENGTFKTGDATKQNQKLLLATEKGEWKQSPTVGVGLSGFINNDNPGEMKAEIIKQFELDGMRVRDVEFDDKGNITVDAEYEED